MALFNYANREITAKVVYYGPGVCGKTTSLEYIHERISPSQRGRLLSLATETDRTIFFDLLPLKLGEINGFKLRFQLYTVPGQVKYNKTRKLVLQGADAIVFVADSQKTRQEANIESFRNLQENLLEQNRKIEEIPLVYEFNKRDLPEILSIEELNAELNPRGVPFSPTIATKGVGVMETLEKISKQALQDMEQRLNAPVSSDDDAEDDNLLMTDALMDLTSEEEDTLDFSSDELGALELESDLSGVLGDDDPLDFALESRPIGYDTQISLEEFEVRNEDVAQTGTLKESEFFNLQNIEEQALKELDSFLDGNEDNDALLNFDNAVTPNAPSDALDDMEGFADFTFGEEEVNEPLSFGEETKDDDNLEFSLSDAEEEESFSSPSQTDEMFDFTGEEETETADAAFSFSLDESTEDESLSFDVEPFMPETEGTLPDFEQPSEAFSLDNEELGDLSFDETPEDESLSFDIEPAEAETSLNFAETSETFSLNDDELGNLNLDEALSPAATGQIESLDLSDSDLDITFDEQMPENIAEHLPGFDLDEDEEAEREEAAAFSAEDEELISFSLDNESQDLEELASFSLDDDTFEIPSMEEEPPLAEDAAASETPFPDFRITDSVKFEMQVGEEISSGTPFEQQLEQLSNKDLFITEDESHEDEFQPLTNDTTEEEEFQVISDEWSRLLVLAKHFHHRGEKYRVQHTTSENLLALMMYYTAIETALKAVASKYETCNPGLASFHLLLESIEEETGKPVAGAQSLRNNIIMMKNRVQLEAVYPDDDECELAARISERFLSSLAHDFLLLDFEKLSPVLPQAETA